MKKISIILAGIQKTFIALAIVSFSFGISSCQDWLEMPDLTAEDSDFVFENEYKADMFVQGCYRGLIHSEMFYQLGMGETVMHASEDGTTNVTKLSTWLPVDTAERPSVVPNLPTTSKSTAPYAACNINAPSIGIIKGISFPNILPCVKSDFELFNVNFPFTHHLVEFVNSFDHRISLFITNIRKIFAKPAVIVSIIFLRQLFTLICNRNISYPCIFL